MDETEASELSEQNFQEQQDEVCAMESIFAEEGNFRVLNSRSSPETQEYYQLELLVPLSLPHSLSLSVIVQEEVDPSSEADSKQIKRSLSGRSWITSIELEHLTPLSLAVTLPHGYPSSSSPKFTLSAAWLSSKQLSLLCQHLDTMWEPGIPVLYTWADWLQNNLLCFLGIEDEIALFLPELEGDEQDCRARSKFNGLENLGALIDYDLKQKHESFLTSTQTCSVCFDDKLGSEFFRLNECLHHFCVECLTNYCQMHVSDGTVNQLRCPEDGCDRSVPPSILQKVLGDEEFARLERLQLERALDSMDDLVWCPRCNFPVVLDAEHSLGVCGSCMFSFCSKCTETWHQGLPCKSDLEKLEELDKKMEDTKTNSRKAMMEKLKRKREEMMSCKTALNISMPCPSCKFPIEKNGGCNKVVCTQCKTSMCYKCGAAIKDYEHFSKSRCNMFDIHGQPDGVRVRVRVQEVHPANLRINAELAINPEARNRLVKCPRCKQNSLKSGRNNHIRCEFCRSNFCFLCKTLFLKLADHFRAGECPQHSD